MSLARRRCTSAADYLRGKTGAPVVIGKQIADVQAIFANLFELDDTARHGSAFDRLVGEGDVSPLGELGISVMHTPGHTPACVTYLIGDAAFVGDTLFMPDYGTARADFPGGNARTLYRSIRKLLSLPDSTRLFTAMTIRHPPALSPHGRRASPNTAPLICMCMMASTKPHLSPCAKRGMRHWKRPC